MTLQVRQTKGNARHNTSLPACHLSCSEQHRDFCWKLKHIFIIGLHFNKAFRSTWSCLSESVSVWTRGLHIVQLHRKPMTQCLFECLLVNGSGTGVQAIEGLLGTGCMLLFQSCACPEALVKLILAFLNGTCLALISAKHMVAWPTGPAYQASCGSSSFSADIIRKQMLACRSCWANPDKACSCISVSAQEDCRAVYACKDLMHFQHAKGVWQADTSV